MRATALAPLALLPLLVSAHFKLVYPPQRDADEDNQATYPCSGASTPSSNRTRIPLGSAFPIQLDLEHTSSNIQVTLATGANPTGADFTHVLVPTLAETGPQAFCIGGVTVPSALVAPGDYGTLLVATNAHGSGGLYNCADVVFVREAMAAADYAAHCSNSTGVAAQAWGSAAGNANGTAAGVVATGTTSAASAASSTVRSRAAVGNRPRGLALVVGVGVSLLVMGAVG